MATSAGQRLQRERGRMGSPGTWTWVSLNGLRCLVRPLVPRQGPDLDAGDALPAASLGLSAFFRPCSRRAHSLLI